MVPPPPPLLSSPLFPLAPSDHDQVHAQSPYTRIHRPLLTLNDPFWLSVGRQSDMISNCTESDVSRRRRRRCKFIFACRRITSPLCYITRWFYHCYYYYYYRYYYTRDTYKDIREVAWCKRQGCNAILAPFRGQDDDARVPSGRAIRSDVAIVDIIVYIDDIIIYSCNVIIYRYR